MNQAVMMTNAKADASTRRGLKWLVAGVVLAISATVALSAWAQPGPGGAGHHGGGQHGMFMGSPRHVERMLDGLSATEAQRAQIKQIVAQAAADLKAQRETSRSLRERGMQIFTAPSVDPAAAESVRQQMLTQHDAASRRTLQAMLDISRVLTPEQRARLGEQMNQRQARMHERMQRDQPKQ
jgi:Spy/CpxP family protein refolding chaperone